MSGCFNYRLFGLRIQSELELPELCPVAAAEETDLLITIGGTAPVPQPGTSFEIDGIASYWIGGGSQVVINPLPSASTRNVRLYLLGSAMGAVLHQRGILPLHANAIQVGERAVAVMGSAGAGKSTLAMAFDGLGHSVIADDVCAVTFDDDGLAVASSGISRLRLRQDALAVRGRDVSNFARSFDGDDDCIKYDVPLPNQDSQFALGGIYLLDDGPAIEIEPLSGLAAVETIFANTYRGHLVESLGSAEQHWSSALRLVQACPIFRLSRPKDLGQLDELCGAIVRHQALIDRP